MSASRTPHTPSQVNTPLVGDYDDKLRWLRHIVQKHRPDIGRFIDIYKDIHQHSKLSCFESRTANAVAKELERIELEVSIDIGGHGVVGILKNGVGKTILTRAELDALSIEEKTGLPCASRERMKDFVGRDQPVMHACSHDIHIAALLASVQPLYSAKDAWSGTLLAVFQPNEELIGGAQGMVNGGLYNACPLSDIILAQHVGMSKDGLVAVRTGPMLTALDHIEIDIFSSDIDSNSSECRDPVSLRNYLVTRFQAIIGADISINDEYTALKCRDFRADDSVICSRTGCIFVSKLRPSRQVTETKSLSSSKSSQK